MQPPADLLDQAGTAVSRSHARRYLRDFDQSTEQLEQAVACLRQLETALTEKRPDENECQQLRERLEAFQHELGQATLLHTQAAAWHDGWARLFVAALGLEPKSGYHPSFEPPSHLMLEA